MSNLDRRSFFSSGICGVLAMAALPSRPAVAKTTDGEKTNIKTVRDWSAAFDTVAASDPPDLTKLVPYFSVDCAFRLRPTGTVPLEYGTRCGSPQPSSASLPTGREFYQVLLWTASRKARIVVMEKLNHFITPEKTRTSHVVAVYVFKDGKIVEWTEYFISVA